MHRSVSARRLVIHLQSSEPIVMKKNDDRSSMKVGMLTGGGMSRLKAVIRAIVRKGSFPLEDELRIPRGLRAAFWKIRACRSISRV